MENTPNSIANMMQQLKGLVALLPSGKQLISCLEEQGLQNSELPKLIYNVLDESKSAAATAATAPRLNLNEALSLITQLSFVTPRGKHDLAFFAEHMVIKTTKNDIVVPYAAIKTLVILDAIPKDTKGKVLLYLHLDSSFKIINGKQPLNAVVIQLLANGQLSIKNPKVPEQQLEGIAAVVMCQVFGLLGVAPTKFSAPSKEFFQSSEGAVGVEAFVKARQGLLFPLPSGLCFLESPAMFIPVADIKSVELARANGTSSTFDFYVHCKDMTHEFSNLSRNEIPAIQEYIRKAKLAQGPADSSSDEENDEEKNQEDADSDSDDPDDEDFNPSSDSDDERPAKKSKKGAAQKDEADEETVKVVAGNKADDEEEDEDEEEDSDEESDDDDSDSDVELVSEDEFSMGQLEKLKEEQKGNNKGGETAG